MSAFTEKFDAIKSATTERNQIFTVVEEVVVTNVPIVTLKKVGDWDNAKLGIEYEGRLIQLKDQSKTTGNVNISIMLANRDVPAFQIVKGKSQKFLAIPV